MGGDGEGSNLNAWLEFITIWFSYASTLCYGTSFPRGNDRERVGGNQSLPDGYVQGSLEMDDQGWELWLNSKLGKLFLAPGGPLKSSTRGENHKQKVKELCPRSQRRSNRVTLKYRMNFRCPSLDYDLLREDSPPRWLLWIWQPQSKPTRCKVHHSNCSFVATAPSSVLTLQAMESRAGAVSRTDMCPPKMYILKCWPSGH